MTEIEHLKNVVKSFETTCIDYATGKDVDYEVYESSRNAVLAEPLLQPKVPQWVVENRYGSQFWGFIKSVSGHYQPRREFIWNSMGGLIKYIEKGGSQPISLSFEEIMMSVTNDKIETVWSKIQLRKETDPEGAITAARTLLETTLKHILDTIGEPYESKDDLTDLYKKVSKKFNLSPEGHNEQIFKQILSGCMTVVGGLATIRNAYGDAHGKGTKNISPEPRHADLAINLSGSVCTFLLATMRNFQREASVTTSGKIPELNQN